MHAARRPTQTSRSRARRCAGATPRPLLALARLRQGTYRLLGSMLLFPDEAVNDAPGAARYLQRMGAWASAFAFYDDWDCFLRHIQALGPLTLPAIRSSYADLFGMCSSPEPVPLCESAYLDDSPMRAGWVIGHIERAYATAGLQIAVSGQPPDHAAVELEFISFLCGREAEGLEARDVTGARSAADEQRRFLQDHLCRWIPQLSTAVAERDAVGFFAAVARAAHAMVVHDVDFLGALVSRPQGEIGAASEAIGAT